MGGDVGGLNCPGRECLEQFGLPVGRRRLQQRRRTAGLDGVIGVLRALIACVWFYALHHRADEADRCDVTALHVDVL